MSPCSICSRSTWLSGIWRRMIALQLGRPAPVPVEPPHHQDVVGLPAHQAERARSRRMRVEPAMPPIVVFGMALHRLAVEDVERGLAEHADQRRVRPADRLHRDGERVNRLDVIADIRRRVAPFRQPLRLLEIERDEPLRRPGHVIRGDGISGLELRTRMQFERDRPVRRHRPGIGEARHRLVVVELDEPVIEVRRRFGGFELAAQRRIERDHVRHRDGDDERVLRCRRPGPGRHGKGRCAKNGGDERRAGEFHSSLLRIPVLAPGCDRASDQSAAFSRLASM